MKKQKKDNTSSRYFEKSKIRIEFSKNLNDIEIFMMVATDKDVKLPKNLVEILEKHGFEKHLENVYIRSFSPHFQNKYIVARQIIEEVNSIENKLSNLDICLEEFCKIFELRKM